MNTTNDDNGLTTAPADNIIPFLRPVKKESVRPADPVLIQPAAAPKPGDKDIVFTPYPDGILFKCSPRPKHPTDFLIHDGAGQIVANVVNKDVANLFCAALHVYFQAAQQNAAAQVAAAPAAPEEKK